MLTKEQVQSYLDRIFAPCPAEVSVESLRLLVQAHLTSVPFEALDVWGSGACPSLDVQELYQKVVINRRGGYCFELNTLFRHLLNGVGFTAYQAIASLLDEDGKAAPPAHNVILCQIGKETYFVDVGFGGPVPFGPMKLNSSCDGFEIKQEGQFFVLYRTEEEKPRPCIRFRDIPAEPCELIPLNFYISQLPGIHFRERIFVNQRQPDGSVYTLLGREFKIKKGEAVSVQPVETMEEIKRILETYFHIDLQTVGLRKTL